MIYDAEHFFDGFKADPVYAVETLRPRRAGQTQSYCAIQMAGPFPGK